MEQSLKTADQAVQDVLSIMVAAGVKAAVNLTGAIYPYNRPLSSAQEDIVINVPTFSADQMQEGLINVNIHVPNLIRDGDNTQPNRARFNVIATSCLSVLDSIFGSDFNFKVEVPGVLVPDKSNWFMNIQLRYYSGREDII